MTRSEDIRVFIRFGSPKTYVAIREAIEGIDEERIQEILAALTPQPDYRRAVLSDSRDVTDYGRVAVNQSARKILRDSGDLSLARQVVEQLSMPDRVGRLVDSGRVFLGELSAADLGSDTLSQVAKTARDLQQLARDMRRWSRDDSSRMTDMIELDIDAYGKYARASAVADYVELLSLKRHNVTREQVTNYAENIG